MKKDTNQRKSAGPPAGLPLRSVTIRVEGDQCVSIWACDRETETDEKEMKKVAWRSCCMSTLRARGALASASVDGFHMCATKSEGYQGQPFNCVTATDSSTLSLARCNLTCESDGNVPTVNIARGASGNLNKCCVRDGQFGIAVMSKGKATLEDNDIQMLMRVWLSKAKAARLW